MRYVFDTNILVFYIKDKETKAYIEKNYSPFGEDNEVIISIVSVGEIRALAIKNSWGTRRVQAIRDLLARMIVVEVRFDELVSLYAELDAYSQGKVNSGQSKFTARNMGKNDLWIAATTRLVEGVLLTADHDFDHLANAHFAVEKIRNQD